MPKIKKTVIVTGGAGRIGSALAADLVKQGDKVLLGDINKSKLLKIKKKLNSKNIEIFQGDLTTKNNIDRFIKFGVKKFKNIHAAVHCSYPTSKKWGARLEDLEEIHLKNEKTGEIINIKDFAKFNINYHNPSIDINDIMFEENSYGFTLLSF